MYIITFHRCRIHTSTSSICQRLITICNKISKSDTFQVKLKCKATSIKYDVVSKSVEIRYSNEHGIDNLFESKYVVCTIPPRLFGNNYINNICI